MALLKFLDGRVEDHGKYSKQDQKLNTVLHGRRLINRKTNELQLKKIFSVLPTNSDSDDDDEDDAANDDNNDGGGGDDGENDDCDNNDRHDDDDDDDYEEKSSAAYKSHFDIDELQAELDDLNDVDYKSTAKKRPRKEKKAPEESIV